MATVTRDKRSSDNRVLSQTALGPSGSFRRIDSRWRNRFGVYYDSVGSVWMTDFVTVLCAFRGYRESSSITRINALRLRDIYTHTYNYIRVRWVERGHVRKLSADTFRAPNNVCVCVRRLSGFRINEYRRLCVRSGVSFVLHNIQRFIRIIITDLS